MMGSKDELIAEWENGLPYGESPVEWMCVDDHCANCIRWLFIVDDLKGFMQDLQDIVSLITLKPLPPDILFKDELIEELEEQPKPHLRVVN